MYCGGLQYLSELYGVVYPNGLQPTSESVHRQHQELVALLDELSVPSEKLMLLYYKSLVPEMSQV